MTALLDTNGGKHAAGRDETRQDADVPLLSRYANRVYAKGSCSHSLPSVRGSDPLHAKYKSEISLGLGTECEKFSGTRCCGRLVSSATEQDI